MYLIVTVLTKVIKILNFTSKLSLITLNSFNYKCNLCLSPKVKDLLFRLTLGNKVRENYVKTTSVFLSPTVSTLSLSFSDVDNDPPQIVIGGMRKVFPLQLQQNNENEEDKSLY